MHLQRRPWLSPFVTGKVRYVRGSENGSAKLTEDDVLAIRRAFIGGERLRSIARRFGCTPQAIGCAIRGKRWAHVTDGIVSPERMSEMLRQRRTRIHEALAGFFRARPNEWISSTEIVSALGNTALRAGVTLARKHLNLTIENRQHRDKGNIVLSEYRYVPARGEQ